jgi:hypothetical protein
MVRSGLAARLAAGVLLAMLAEAAVGDTLGYLPATRFADQVTIARSKGPTRVSDARNQQEWSAAWKAAGGTGTAKAVDFERQMVVGVVNGRGEDRVIYRIQLDSGDDPRFLEVHLGVGGAYTREGATPRLAGAQFVVTPRSALPVRFVYDEMVDGGVFGMTNTEEGVESHEVAAIAGVRVEAAGKAPLREEAERAVVAALSAAERKKLLRGPMDQPMKRFPHGWTRLDVVRLADRWTIRYDDLAFEVDVATGDVTRR